MASHLQDTTRARRPCAPSPIALAAFALLCGTAAAQEAALPAQRVTARPLPVTADVAGFGRTEAWRSPLQSSRWSEDELARGNVDRLADLVNLNASISDSYNSPGYWDTISVRGYTLDNKTNYKRDGLPISAETSIPLDNKAGVEVLEGTSGIQSGVSSPGGLVNYIVKRPTGSVRSIRLRAAERGSLLAAADLGQRFGTDARFGLRVNAAYERLRPEIHDLQGHRSLLALAGDWRLTPDTLLEAEFEHSRKSQPSVPGYSLLGSVLPSARDVDPRLNLNNQSWSQPVVFQADTASLRFTQRLDADWSLAAHAAVQRLKTDDRLAYAYGCSAEGQYDRYCSDGSFDLSDYRSENERRHTDALDLSANGRLDTAGFAHELRAGVLLSRFAARFEDQVYSFAGFGTVDGRTQWPVPDQRTTPSTNRSEHSTEWSLRDRITLTPQLQAWLGLRHTRLERSSVNTQGGERVDPKSQSFTTPWLGLSHEFAPKQVVYASWGQGIESYVVPNRAIYADKGRFLPAQRSRQAEIGLKAEQEHWNWSAALFSIHQPALRDAPYAGGGSDGTGFYGIDGRSNRLGLQGSLAWREGPWSVQGSVQLLQARIRGSSDATIDGKRPTNVPQQAFKFGAAYELPAVTGLTLLGNLAYEGRRAALPDNSAFIPGWTRVDAGAEYRQKLEQAALTWSLGISNLFDRRAWRESPFQYGHAYLYPLAPRTWRLALQVDL